MEKNKIPTAEEYCREHQNSNHPDMISKLMRDFAQLHVKAALEAAAEKGMLTIEKGTNVNGFIQAIDKNSILNAYPENLIK